MFLLKIGNQKQFERVAHVMINIKKVVPLCAVTAGGVGEGICINTQGCQTVKFSLDISRKLTVEETGTSFGINIGIKKYHPRG